MSSFLIGIQLTLSFKVNVSFNYFMKDYSNSPFTILPHVPFGYSTIPWSSSCLYLI